MQATEKLRQFKKEFDKKLFAFLDQKEKEAKKIDPSCAYLIKEIKRLARSGGKRLRPAFVFYGYKAVGGQKLQDVWPACLAIELIHSFALIHDDIMDSSELRRGKPTTWKLLGANEALLIGDLAFALAEEIFSKVRPCRNVGSELVQNYWQKLKFEVIAGQFLDIASNTPPRCPELAEGPRCPELAEGLLGPELAEGLLGGGGFKEADVVKIMDIKSGRYTIARPLQIGAAVAGASQKVLDSLFEYGVNLGVAFQIQDDILGMFGEKKAIGKPADSDLKEGKRTLLIVKTLEEIRRNSLKLAEISSESEVVRKFEGIFGNKDLTKKDLQWVRDLVVKSQVLDWCQKKAKQYIKKAKKSLEDIELEKESKEFLLGIAEYILNRKK